MSELAIAANRLIVLGKGTVETYRKELALTSTTRRRLGIAGAYYQSHASLFAEDGASIVIGDDEPNSDVRGTKFIHDQFIERYQPPKEVVKTVNAAGTPFRAFQGIIEQKIFGDKSFTPEDPLLIATNKAYGRLVMAPIARAAFGITDEAAVETLPTEWSGVRRHLRSELLGKIVGVVIEDVPVEPYDSSSLAQASERYDKILQDRKGAFGD